jgi:hypothetical protein
MAEERSLRMWMGIVIRTCGVDVVRLEFFQIVAAPLNRPDLPWSIKKYRDTRRGLQG